MKRGSSGLSLVLGIDKPSGMTSHDLVNTCRGIFKEKRIGHAGTLDPDASGVLIVCVGPATRLNSHLSQEDKRYRFELCFGASTDTDDASGRVLKVSDIPQELSLVDFAKTTIEKYRGPMFQIPPAFSAIQVEGKRAYKAARQGEELHLEPRRIEIYSISLLGIHEKEPGVSLSWELEVHASKGTYIRALARDIGETLGCPAHADKIRRIALGTLDVDDCVSIGELEELKEGAALDPLSLLNYRSLILDEKSARLVANGASLDASFYASQGSDKSLEGTSSRVSSIYGGEDSFFQSDELIAMLNNNKLIALYRYNQQKHVLKPDCIFSVGVTRGKNSKS